MRKRTEVRRTASTLTPPPWAAGIARGGGEGEEGGRRFGARVLIVEGGGIEMYLYIYIREYYN